MGTYWAWDPSPPNQTNFGGEGPTPNNLVWSESESSNEKGATAARNLSWSTAASAFIDLTTPAGGGSGTEGPFDLENINLTTLNGNSTRDGDFSSFGWANVALVTLFCSIIAGTVVSCVL